MPRTIRPGLTLTLTLLALWSCQTSGSYATSLLGRPLPRPVFEPVKRSRLEADLQAARQQLAEHPRDEMAWIWFGRRLAYLGRYREAVDAFSNGLTHYPGSFRLLRHRGHRYITLRRFDLAVADLQAAAAAMPRAPLLTEPDGVPNALNRPISTTQGNVWYHLGLAEYLRGNFEAALAAYDKRLQHSDRNDDNRCSTAYWRHLILARLGRQPAARAAVASIRRSMEIVENHSYRDLCLLFQGALAAQDLQPRPRGGQTTPVLAGTLAYGLAMHQYLRGDSDQARAMWEQLIGSSRATSAFGYIAAEAELARLGRSR